MATTTSLVLGAATVGVLGFCLWWVSPVHPLIALRLALPTVLALGVVAGAAWASARVFGREPVRLPGLIGAVAVTVCVGLLYAQALRPKPPFDDTYEPNLVFLFAPIYLGVVASLLAVLIVLASWLRSRAEPV